MRRLSAPATKRRRLLMRGLGLAALNLLALALPPAPAGAGQHPLLPSAEPALCRQCHVRLVLGPSTVHPPVAEDCTTCHDVSVSPEATTISLVEEAPDLCLLCHDDVGEIAETAEVPHGALELGSCTDCHDPHAADQSFLITRPGGGVCAECHEDQVADDDEVEHGAVELIGCNACHEPHGGSEAVLMRRTGNELCLSCHDATLSDLGEQGETVEVLESFEIPVDRARTMATLRLSGAGQDHPASNHPVSGAPGGGESESISTTFEGELACLSCHDPHKGRSPQLLVGDATTAAASCQRCHPQ